MVKKSDLIIYMYIDCAHWNRKRHRVSFGDKVIIKMKVFTKCALLIYSINQSMAKWSTEKSV